MTSVGEAAGRPAARPRVSRFGATTALIVAFVALAVAWAGMGAVTYRLATAPVRTNLILSARLDGVLSAQTNIDGTACFWVGKRDGSDSALLAVGIRSSRQPPRARVGLGARRLP